MKNILRRNGYDTGPNRGKCTCDEFLKQHAKTMWQCDFFSKKIVSKTGLRVVNAIEDAKIKTQRTAFRSPNTVAFVERFVQSIKQEALDHFVVFGRQHMDVICAEYVEHYLSERPHQGLDNELIQKPFPTQQKTSEPTVKTIRLGDIRCKERLGGLLKSYSRKAA